jgi:hypothetical protein
MGAALDKLLSISSDSLSTMPTEDVSTSFPDWDTTELLALLARRNGFYAFESALHVLPWSSDASIDLAKWNDGACWKADYDGRADPYLFFAENVLGYQFALSMAGIVTFDPETASVNEVATSLEEWAQVVLDDYRWQTAWPLAHDWQVEHGILPEGMRLIPVIPFILGGEFSVDNLMAMEAVEAMRLRADFWRQTRDLPEGTQIKIQLPPPKASE